MELRAALVGAAVALLAWFAPGVVGGGDAITQRMLSAQRPLPCCRWFFWFASDLGRCRMQREHPADCSRPSWYQGPRAVLFGNICYQWFPATAPNPTALAVVGMAAFFTAVVRAPLTGIILVTEMTASFLAFADAQRLFRGDAGAKPAARCAYL